MNGKLRVGVIFGGRSGEHEVSLMSARSVLNALDRSRYAVTEIGIDPNGDWLVGLGVLEVLSEGRRAGDIASPYDRAVLLPLPSRRNLYALRPAAAGDPGTEILAALTELDVVFPVLHGTFGEDGTLQGLLEMADLAYVGAGVLGSALGMDKAVFKDVMRANGIPVLEGRVVLRSEIERDPESVLSLAEALAPYPLFVKPANLGSSVGVTKCRTRSDLYEGLMEAARYDRRILVERGIEAREIEVSVLGNDYPEASIPGEIIPSGDFYTYAAKYHDERSELLIPAPLPDDLIEEIRSLAVQAYRAIDCGGLARVDFLLEKGEPSPFQGEGRAKVEPSPSQEDDRVKVDPAPSQEDDRAKLEPSPFQGECRVRVQRSAGVYLNEINTIPGFTRISMYPKLWEASGLSYPALVDRLIELALERKAQRDRTERSYESGK